MSAVLSAKHSRFGRSLALLWTSVEYDFRRVSAFRAGFILREILRGVTRPIVMIFVLRAVYESRGGAPINGLTLTAATQYMILLAVLEKTVFHERVLDLAEQIFLGYVTKFLVMPFPYFVLPLGRYVQYTLTQTVVAVALFTIGAIALPDVWPMPASTGAALMAVSLTLSASFCFLLLYFIINTFAFWLDLVWTLLVMSRFVVLFIAGAILPPALLPDAVRAAFQWLFPYWAIGGPIEIWSGRAGFDHWVRGMITIACSACVLEVARRVAWRRGLLRYGGSGM